MTGEQFEQLPTSEKRKVLALYQQIAETNKRRNILTWFPDRGKYPRHLYPKHLEFFRAGAQYRDRLFLAANRVGKSVTAAYEVACHVMGCYPDWWEGYRFNRPVKVWASSKTSAMTRDFVQRYLTGPWNHFGTGMICGELFTDKDWTPKRGIPEAVDVIRVQGRFGESEIAFKSYDQGWESYQGTERDIIWNDEECNELIRNECRTRLMTTEGLYIFTFTPLSGVTPVVRKYLSEDLRIKNESPTKYIVNCGWRDVPHITKEVQEEELRETPAYLVDAKSKGLPSRSAGAVYPLNNENDVKVDPFKIPDWWPRVFGMDVGWNRTAVIWGAIDKDSDTIYLYSEYYGARAQPSIHADAIKARGKWIPGVIDPNANGRGQADGKQLFKTYQEDMELDITKANNSVTAGIGQVWQRLESGRIKIFSTLINTFTELRMYHTNEEGKIIKEDDHLMDALRYLVVSGLARAITKAEAHGSHLGDVHGFTPVDSVTGY